MFTGIVEELGVISAISKRGNITVFTAKAAKILEDTGIGDSVSVNGACLTVVKKENDSLSFEAMPETLKVTTLGGLRISDRVNLERSLKLGERLSGHFVTGHIDCLGVIRSKSYINGNLCFKVSIPSEFNKYLLPKGSVAVDGISLTIMEKASGLFKGPSHKVNVEFDILAKKSVAA
jgi:riboflavin synthase